MRPRPLVVFDRLAGRQPFRRLACLGVAYSCPALAPAEWCLAIDAVQCHRVVCCGRLSAGENAFMP